MFSIYANFEKHQLYALHIEDNYVTSTVLEVGMQGGDRRIFLIIICLVDDLVDSYLLNSIIGLVFDL